MSRKQTERIGRIWISAPRKRRPQHNDPKTSLADHCPGCRRKYTAEAAEASINSDITIAALESKA